MGWSSAIRTRIIRLLLFSGVKGNNRPDICPPVRKMVDRYLSAEATGTLPHADEPERQGIGKLLYGDPLAVVRHAHYQFITPCRKGHLDPRCFRMPANVGQCLLSNTKQRSGATVVQYAA